MPKCLAAAEIAIQNKKNVVIDNTNPTQESRKDFVALAKKHSKEYKKKKNNHINSFFV